ncbi:MAG: carboxylating nicotinate-nucleotide diphosphorylase [Algoriphagus sp.]|jgi:nicotinate-nucleotide pyrophosphorylase (carboxylating)|uniref:carboxylating nicotinate-nucleotide diphosphorylase n=1 Tax=Algoriphagus sp. TaxID=1872435 RepID=UPI00272157CF|nr:carboxylating nicotinate-nucleotide diphosphorylase [Algoriphagus sp.]MDO8968936.1 carboxylating nicotinate-nucleotide diphosphorylase [Algoriphagus sp.]MDP2041350.1 carboxylating nicotinate-nucleotide diphosphorylase [Algoriphagus sp.]MDP3202090.1 carboxylating nicotinate-nucleotide diphosphorylase [Algoriphagus sp.]MDP3470910.1 carboxylating nicotinate-nucleotide diphosphorylase [Algoriphagus sp.]
MKPAYLTPESLQNFIQSALLEDIGPGDYSSLASIPEGKTGKAKLLIKDDGILAGVELAGEIFKAVDPRLEVQFLKKDGDPVKAGDVGLVVSGPSASILSAERLVLNCMQRMSAIATKTHRLSQLISHTKAKLMDTRKTTPNFRLMEKWAVLIGGGVNHRFALYDMVMLKDNHVDFAGGIRAAIDRTKKYLSDHSLKLKIEIETRNLAEVKEVLAVGGVDYIMLDNMDYSTMREAVRLIDGKYSTEASGGITENTLAAVAECGVDYISMGALTHSVSSLDISLKAI